MRSPRARVLAGVALAATLVAVAPRPAWACTCAAATTKQHFDGAHAVFVGTVMATQTGAPNAPIQVSFAVEEVFKGRVLPDYGLTTAASGSMCGVPFVVGHRYVVFATERAAAPPEASICGGTTNDLGVLERAGYRHPKTTYDDEAVSLGGSGPDAGRAADRTGTLIAAGILIALAGGWLAQRALRDRATGATEGG